MFTQNYIFIGDLPVDIVEVELELGVELEAKEPKTSDSRLKVDWINAGFETNVELGGANKLDGFPGGGKSTPLVSVPSCLGVFRGTLILIFSPTLRLRSLSGAVNVVSTPFAAWSSRSHSLEVFRERCQVIMVKRNVVYSSKKQYYFLCS